MRIFKELITKRSKFDKWNTAEGYRITESTIIKAFTHELISYKAVLWIRDVYPGSRILIFTHPGSRIQKQQQKIGVKKNLMSL